jgi:hypothetical protein
MRRLVIRRLLLRLLLLLLLLLPPPPPPHRHDHPRHLMQGYSERNFSWSFCDFASYAYRDHANDPVSSYFDAGSAITKSESDANYSSASLAFPINRLKDDMCVPQCASSAHCSRPTSCCQRATLTAIATHLFLRHNARTRLSLLDNLLMTILSAASACVVVAAVFMCALP